MKWAGSLLAVIALAVPVGCGSDGSGGARSDSPAVDRTNTATTAAAQDAGAEEPKFRQGPRGYPVADAPDAATAQQWCDEAEKGRFRSARLRGEAQVRFLLPRPGDRRFICALPPGRQRFLRQAKRMQRGQKQLDELFERHERHGHNEF
jgi:hypothetical protein